MTHLNRLLPLATFVLLLASLWIAGIGYTYMQERQATYRLLSDAQTKPKENLSSPDWQSAKRQLSRPVTALDENLIGQALTNAWANFVAAQESGDASILPDHFSGPALARATLAANQAHRAGTRTAMLSLTVQPLAYHLDGSLFQAECEILTLRYARNGPDLTALHLTRDRTISTLSIESTGWKLLSHERRAATPLTTPPRAVKIPRLAGFNYYPARTPWRKFWANFDRDAIRSDFPRAAEMGANALRIFLPREDFLNADKAQDHRNNLRFLLNTAQRHGLHVIPTLFDMRQDYALSGWTADAQLLQSLAPLLGKHPAVAFVDLKNEPDLDFQHHGRARVMAWLHTMAALHRLYAPETPLTIGWASPEAAPLLAETVDLITYHDYGDLSGTTERLTKVRQMAGEKQVMVTEIGYSSFSLLGAWPGSHEKQAQQLADRLTSLRRADGLFIWSLNDFPNPDKAAVGASPWVLALQSQFGMIDANGILKPAASIARRHFLTFLKRSPQNAP
jgi:hypothetical protein